MSIFALNTFALIYILQIETSTTNCSVALSENGKTVAVQEVSNGYSHAENLHVFIKEVLKKCHLEFTDLNAIAVSKGPGSYTGLRIGVSAAKGLCFALDIPLIALETLQILAQQITIDANFIVPMIDARRLEAYTKVYDSQYNSVREIEAEILNETSFLDYLSKGVVVFVGNKTDKTKEIIQHENARFVDSVPSAKNMSALAYNKFKISDIEDVAYFEPYYLKDFLITPAKKKI